MTETQFIKKIHRRLAQITIGSSALRNQGAPGMVDAARQYLEEEISLKDFFGRFATERRYNSFLDSHTERLRRSFPNGGRSWGAARKALNLFFRELVYNKFLADRFGLPVDFYQFNETVQHLEVPLDRDVALELINHSTAPLPKWKSIKSLMPTTSRQFQAAARTIADSKGIARVHLDLIYWRG